jgi:hypothetical protein
MNDDEIKLKRKQWRERRAKFEAKKDEIRNSAPPASQDETTQMNEKKNKWKKGMASPHPAGRPRNPKNIQEVRQLAREKTGAMIEFLTRTALNPKVGITARVQAAMEILNRGWGRPQQSLDLNHGIQDGLAALLEEIDGRGRLKTIEGSVIRRALEVKQPLLHHGQDGESDQVQSELGARKLDE